MKDQPLEPDERFVAAVDQFVNRHKPSTPARGLAWRAMLLANAAWLVTLCAIVPRRTEFSYNNILDRFFNARQWTIIWALFLAGVLITAAIYYATSALLAWLEARR
jgi:hypothetical protein